MTESQEFALAMPATAKSRVPPVTKIPLIDEYYANFDTQEQIEKIKYLNEFSRLQETIEKVWQLKGTPREEVEAVRAQLASLKGSHRDSQATLLMISKYLSHVKTYYQREDLIANVY